jgi:ABC-type transport system substrate-binding protein
MNYIMDKAKLLEEFGGGIDARPIGHVVIDSLEGNDLLNYDPFHTASADAALAAAKSEMAQSAYDTNHDGTCGAALCKHVYTIVMPFPSFQSMAQSIGADLAKIGIVLDAHTPSSVDDFFSEYLDTKQHTIAMAIMVAWGKDFFSPEDYFQGQFAAGAPGMMNLGQTPDQLRSRGYAVTSVPAVDDRIAECSPLTGSEASRCWSALDQYVTEKVAPVVPIFDEYYTAVIPKRVLKYSFDQYWNLPAPDEIAIQH